MNNDPLLYVKHRFDMTDMDMNKINDLSGIFESDPKDVRNNNEDINKAFDIRLY